MKIEEIIKKINQKQKGSQRTVIQSRPAKVRKDFSELGLVKVSELKIRFVDYEAQKAVEAAREAGRKKEPNQWEKLSDSVFRDHKGQIKVGVAPSLLKDQKNHSYFLLNGRPISKGEVEPMLLSSEKKENSAAPDWYTLNADNIVDIR